MRISRFLRAARRGDGADARSRRARRFRACWETLDGRAMLAAGASSAAIESIIANPSLDVLSITSTAPTGYSPAQIRAAYDIDGITLSGGVAGDGTGETIAVVDAYDDPDIASDLSAFDAEYGLSAPASFTVDNLGATTTDAAWALETALDVEWAHAIAPGASIVLVEAASDDLASLFDAVRSAADIAGVSVVSMSWGTNEFAGETQYDSLFSTPAGHTGITYVAASGDNASTSGISYPSASPDVLAVGGTTLNLSASGSYLSESAWNDTTGGFSQYESIPSYQVATLEAAGLDASARTTPDVSLDGDPDTGYAVYDSVTYEGSSGWFDVGGTSAATPAWAGLVAIANQGLATVGQGTLTTTDLLDDLYSLPSSDFNDITTGSNGYSATAGYDLATGLGTPKADLVVAGIVSDSSSSRTSTTASSSSSSGITVVSTSSSAPTPTSSPSPTKTRKTHQNETRTKETRTKETKAKQTRASKTKAKKASLTQAKAARSAVIAQDSRDEAPADRPSSGTTSPTDPGMQHDDRSPMMESLIENDRT